MVYASCNVTSLYLLYDTMLEPGIINHDFSMIAKFSKNQARTLETTVDIKIYSPIESTCSATMDEDTPKKTQKNAEVGYQEIWKFYLKYMCLHQLNLQ